MRKKIVAGNWKMNKAFDEADDLLYNIVENLGADIYDKVEVVICPPAVYLELATDVANETMIKVGAQNISSHESGAYTGEISALMLSSLDVDYCIIGHSERRKYFFETNDILSEKVLLALKYRITPILCCGEVLKERESGSHFSVVENQLTESLFHLDENDFKKVVIAYEPVWAIGTGVNATPDQAQEMHAYIRDLIRNKYGSDTAQMTSILYGGSCNSKNAKELFGNPDVDGGLIGGASLDADEFVKVVKSV